MRLHLIMFSKGSKRIKLQPSLEWVHVGSRATLSCVCWLPAEAVMTVGALWPAGPGARGAAADVLRVSTVLYG